MVQKIRAAVDARTDQDFTIIVRTDSLAVTGWDDCMRRCEAYIDAGADLLFVEALRTPEQAERAVKSFDVPLLYNFVETGKSPLIPAPELEQLGFKVVIFPASALLTVCRAVTDLMQQLRELGTTSHLLDRMVSLEDCFNIVGLTEMLSLDASYGLEPQTTI
jgi:2-methylisocitrate lyase-like PEP mutase family enzyme